MKRTHLRATQLGIALAFFNSGTWAQTITVYQNDFETPASLNCPSWGGTAMDSVAAQEYGSAFEQVATADRLCINPIPAPTGTEQYSDPSGKAGKYAVGFYGSGSPPNNESLALAIDPQGKPNVTVDVDLSIVKIANYSGSPVNFNPSTTFSINFYKLPANQTYSLAPPAAMGNPAIVNGSSSANLSPLPDSQQVTINNSQKDPYTFDWNTKKLHVDTSQFATGEQLVVLFTALPANDYVAIDNLVITAAVPELSIACTPSVLTDSASQTSICTITSSVPAPAGGLSIGMTPPTANPRYDSSSCLASMNIAAGALSASCTIAATPNTTSGDGNVVATLGLVAGAGYVLGNPVQASVTVNDDDTATVVGAAQPVPALGFWALWLLALGIAGFGSKYMRRSH